MQPLVAHGLSCGCFMCSHLHPRSTLATHCINTVTASRGSTLTLALATVATLHYCSHFLTWQCTYSHTAVTDSLTRHCICTAFTASRGSTLTLSRATASTLRSLPHVAVPLEYSFTYHCTYSGSALTLARATAAALHHCSHFLTWQCYYSLTRHCSCTASIQSLPPVAVH